MKLTLPAPRFTSTLTTVLFFGLQALTVNAQVEVRDSQPVNITPPPATVAQPPAQTLSPQADLYYQIQALQQEVQQLRGLIEEQSYQLKKLKQQRLDDYLELDRRIGSLGGNSRAADTATANTSTKPEDSVNDRILNPSVSNTLPVAAAEKPETTAEETALYRKAIDQVLKQQDYDAAQDSFKSYLTRYPQGRFVPNVYYWQGEIFLVQGSADSAVASFSNLLDQYPEHNKVPDAKFKLAKLYFQQGKKAEAKPLLEDVATSQTDAARLAKSFLKKNY